jgi:predicted alpha/beta hydrolase family esterase
VSRIAYALAIASCVRGEKCTEPGCDATKRPVQSRYYANPGSDTVIVFFHGIFGDPLKTWSAGDTASSFPRLIAEDSTLNHPGVFLVGYDSPLLGRAPTIEQNAQKVKQDLIDQGVFDHKNVIFLAHSEGGLVARRVIQKISDGDRLPRVKGVLLFAVPVHGANAAERTYWLSLNPQLRDMRPDEFNSMLQSWEEDWEDLFRRASDSARSGNPMAVPAVYCAYETKALGPVVVVPALYASTHCDKPYPLPLDHSSIVKPRSRTDDPYPWTRARIVDALSGVRTSGSLDARSVRRIATHPLSYLPAAAPSDRCQYLPCPDAGVSLDALTGDVQPAREFPLASSPRMAVINLNPFAHRNVVLVATRAHTDAQDLAVARRGTAAAAAARRVDSATINGDLPPHPCELDQGTTARIRAAHTAVAAALPPVSAWLRDSLTAPREAVQSRQWKLAGILRNDREPAARVFEAAWLLDTLASIYGPAVHQSGLLDSSRIVRLNAVAEQFVREVNAIPPCTSNEVATWRSEAEISSDILSRARTELSEVRSTIQALDERAHDAWATAQHPGNFYFVGVIGPYARPTDVIVTLHHLPVDSSSHEVPSAENAELRWVLYFHDGPPAERVLTKLRRDQLTRRVATPSPTARSSSPR